MIIWKKEEMEMMKKRKLKKVLSIALAAVMALSLAACGGGKDNGDENTPGSNNGGDSTSGGTTSGSTLDPNQKYYRADYLSNTPEALKNGGTNMFIGDRLFYSSYNDDYTQQTIYSYNVVTGETVTYWSSARTTDVNDPFAPNVYLNSFSADAEGNLYILLQSSQLDETKVNIDDYADTTFDDILNYMASEWGLGTYDDAKEYWDQNMAEQYGDEPNYAKIMMQWTVDSTNYIQKQLVTKVDASGNVVFDLEFAQMSENSACSGMCADAEGYLYMAYEEWSETSNSNYIKVFDPQGAEAGRIDLDSYISRLMTLSDGSCAYGAWNSEYTEYSLYTIDRKSLKATPRVNFGNTYINNFVQVDDHTLLIGEDRGTSYFDINTQEKTPYVTWMDCNISSNSVQAFSLLSDGRLAVFVNDYSQGGAEIAVLSEISYEEACKVSRLKAVCFYLDYDVQNKILSFNKKHSDYHIDVEEYYNYSSEVDYMDAMNSFATSIASRNDIDIVFFNDYGQMLNYAAKGLLIDLSDVMANDAEVNKNTVMPNILKACELDGKLVALPKSFGITTLVGKTSDVGNTPGWTVSDMKQLLASKPAGTQLVEWMTRSEALSTCLSLGYSDFVDLVNRTSNFNCDAFIDVLEFANLFPEEYNSDMNGEVDSSELMHNGQILLYQTNLPNFAQMQMLTAVFGGELTPIGFPTANGNGAKLSLYNLAGITKNCGDTAMAWEFLRQIYLPSTENYYSDYDYNGSILTSEFDKYFETVASSKEFDGSSWGWGQFEVELHAPTQAEVDQTRDLILNTTAVDGGVSTNIMNIITEEADAYFTGQKDARSVAAIIQSRVDIYLSETQ